MVDTIRSVHSGKRRIPPEIAVEIAEHHADDSLTEREIEVLNEVAAGNANKIVADPRDLRRNRQGSHEEHSFEARSKRSHPCRNDRFEAWNDRDLGAFGGAQI